MASVATLSLAVTRGEDRTVAGTHQTSASDTTAVNITGWTMVFTVRDAGGAVLFSKTVTVVSGGAGTYSFTLSASDTTVSVGSYPCDLWRTDSGSATVMGIGILSITADVRV